MSTIKINRHFTIVAVAFTMCAISYSEASAQRSIFSGAGIKGMMQEGEAEASSMTKPWKGIFNREGAELPERKPLTFPKLGLFKNSAPDFNLDVNENSRPRLFDGLPKLFPERNTERPNLFADLNERTKSLFSRPSFDFSGWAARKNETARSKTFETWEAISRGFKNPLLGKGLESPMAQPPVRSAQRAGKTPSVRF